VEVQNRTLAFNARRYEDGSASGQFEYQQLAGGEVFKFNVDVTCMALYDGNRAKIGGVVKQSNDPTVLVGSFAWFVVFDNGEGANAPPDQSSSSAWRRGRQRASATAPDCLRFGP
jgi:hypothetical protein